MVLLQNYVKLLYRNRMCSISFKEYELILLCCLVWLYMNMLDCGTNEWDQLLSGSVLTPKNHVDVIQVMVIIIIIIVVVVITVTFIKCSL